MQVTTLEWLLSVGAATSVLLIDVFLIGRSPKVPSMRACATALALYVGLALAFATFVWTHHGHRYGLEFLAGWVTEYSLSVDNLFIFIVIMTSFAVPRHRQQQALLIGIVLALILRGIFIAAGAAAIESFSWIFYIFGLFLLYTAGNLLRDNEHDDDGDNAVVRIVRRRLPVADHWDGGMRLFIREGGVRMITPMALVIVALGSTDLLFALDSIPAVYGLTSEPYLVLTANIFALMGLRQLYFLLGGLLGRLVFLSQGLAFLLAFIGVKLVLHALHSNELPFINGGRPVDVPEISTVMSLIVIVGTLVLTTMVSLAWTALHPESREPDGRPD